MEMLQEISEIKFSVASYNDIISQSSYPVITSKYTDNKKNTLYDNRGGAVFTKICETCKQDKDKCPGHFGHIELNTVIIHPLFFNHVFSLLKIICHNCSNIILTKEHLELNDILKITEGEKRLFEIIKKVKNTKNISNCFHCGEAIRTYIIKKDPPRIFTKIIDENEDIVEKEMTDEEIYNIFDDVNENTESLLASSHPRNYFLKAWPVIPLCCRPCEKVAGVLKEDDLTRLLADIIKANNNLLSVTTPEQRKIAIDNLKIKIESFCKPRKTGSNIVQTENLNNICDMLKGKQGIIRMNLMGKRTDMCARAVIGAGPDLKINEVGVPKNIANNISFPVEVYSHNYEEVMEMINNGEVKQITRDGKIIRVDLLIMKDISDFLKFGDVIIRKNREKMKIKNPIKLFEGDRIFRNGIEITPEKLPQLIPFKLEIKDIAHRSLRNGDWLLMNRQPSLHRGSMISFKAVIKNQKTFTLNLAVCKSFNADFDGDEMNAHFPQSLEAKTELSFLSTAKESLNSNINGNPIIVIQQDALLGAYLMTQDDAYIVNKEEYFDIIMVLSREFSYYQEKQKDIENVLKKHGKYVGFKSLCKGKAVASLTLPRNFYIKTEDLEIENGVIIKGFLSKKYLGSGSGSLLKTIEITFSADECEHFINDIQFITNKWLTYHSFTIDMNDVLPSKNCIDINKVIQEAELIKKTILNPQLAEAKIKVLLSNAQEIGMKIPKPNNIVTTIEAGSKGDYFNLGQTKGIVGQQLINGKRLSYRCDNGKRANIHFPRKNPTALDEYHAKGFCSTGLTEGLTAETTNMLAHAMSGRQGICDTAASTNKCGYNQRRIIKHNEDCVIKADGTVRDSNDNLLMLRSNNDGFSPCVNENYIKNVIDGIFISF